jgi:hypothetical protein
MPMKRAAAALFLLVSSIGYAASKSATVPRRNAAPATARPPRQAMLSDAEIEKAIRARFATSKISTHHFQVHVQGGVATIEGQTDVLQHKGVATRLAKTAGAIKVVNRVAVSQAAKDKAAKNLASGRRRAQIKRSDTTKRSAKRSQ